MGPFAQLLDALAETTHVLTVAVRCGDRTLAERTLRDARAIHGELFTSGSQWLVPDCTNQDIESEPAR